MSRLKHKGMMGFIIVRIITAALLIWALSKHPYGYYTLLRFVVCGVTAFGVYFAAEFKRIGWAWIFGIIAILFNPIFPIRLDRNTWAIIDVGVAVILLISIFILKVSTSGKVDAD